MWERIASWWSEQIGEGNDFQRRLIMPATDRLLDVRAGDRVVDLCCGNGNYARRLGRLGCQVLACDGAQSFVEAAIARTTPTDGDISYQLCDATDRAAIERLAPPGSIDAAVCSMAVMDLPVLEPLLIGVGRLVRPFGRFVFSLSHPCFNSPATQLTAELASDAGRSEQRFGVAVRTYKTPTVSLTSGILNQPEPHPHYHRPLEGLLGACFASGWMMDGLLEPSFPPGVSAKSAFSWAKRPELPPALVVRLRSVALRQS